MPTVYNFNSLTLLCGKYLPLPPFCSLLFKIGNNWSMTNLFALVFLFLVSLQQTAHWILGYSSKENEFHYKSVVNGLCWHGNCYQWRFSGQHTFELWNPSFRRS